MLSAYIAVQCALVIESHRFQSQNIFFFFFFKVIAKRKVPTLVKARLLSRVQN